MRSGNPIGISTAMIFGASGALATSTKRGMTRTRTASPAGRTKAAIHPAWQPSTPASQFSCVGNALAPSNDDFWGDVTRDSLSPEAVGRVVRREASNRVGVFAAPFL